MDEPREDEEPFRPIQVGQTWLLAAIAAFMSWLFGLSVAFAGVFLAYGTRAWGEATGVFAAGFLPGFVSMGFFAGFVCVVTQQVRFRTFVLGFFTQTLPLMVGLAMMKPLSVWTVVAGFVGAVVAFALVPRVSIRLSNRKWRRWAKPGTYEENF